MNYVERSAEVAKKVLDLDYFVGQFNSALYQNKMTVESVIGCQETKNDLIEMWNTFWLLLPDISAIRRSPFIEVCDLAEEIFD